MIPDVVRRVGGLLFCLVGAAGIALCVFFVGQIGWAAHQLTEHTPGAVAQLERAVDHVRLRGADAASVVRATRERLQWVRETVDDLPTDGRSDALSPVLATVNVDIMTSLERAESFVRSMQTNLESASGALLLLESIPFLDVSLSQPRGSNGQSNLRTLASGLNDVSAALSQGATLLSEIRVGGGVEPAQVVRLQEALKQVDDQLVLIQEETDRFNAAVVAMDARLDEATAHIQQRIRWLAGIAITLFVCFAFAQLNLVLQGWRWMGRGAETHRPQSK